MEAVLGALFLDGGRSTFVRRYVMGEAAEQLAENGFRAALGNYKSALQEYAQSAHMASRYRVQGESGPDHRKRFVVEVRLKTEDGEPGQPLAAGRGSTKKLAEQDAARRALERLTAWRMTADDPLEHGVEERSGMSIPAEQTVRVEKQIGRAIPILPTVPITIFTATAMPRFSWLTFIRPYPHSVREHGAYLAGRRLFTISDLRSSDYLAG